MLENKTKALAKRVAYATNAESHWPAIQYSTLGDVLTAVATDGHRLAMATCQRDNVDVEPLAIFPDWKSLVSQERPYTLTVDRKAFTKVLIEADKVAKAELIQRKANFRAEGKAIPLLAGREKKIKLLAKMRSDKDAFRPNSKCMTPQERKDHLKKADELHELLERAKLRAAKLASADNATEASMCLRIRGENLHVECVSFRADIPVKHTDVHGNVFDLRSFRVKYLLEAIKNLASTTTEVTIRYDKQVLGSFEIADPDGHYRALIAACRIGG